MRTVTKEQIYDRWDDIPENLKEAFFSLENSELIWKTCEENGLTKEATDNVLIVVGNILLGFTHINDLAKELQSISGIDQKAIDPIIFQVDQKIFTPIKRDIVNAYGAMSGNGPKIVAESGSVISSETVRMSGDEFAGQPVEGTPGVSAPAMMAQEAQVEIRKVKIGGEIGETGAVKAEEMPEAAHTEPAAGPAIIHSEVELKPIAQKKRALSSFGGMFGFRKAQDSEREAPGVAAQVTGVAGKSAQDMARTAQQPVRVVHYTSAKAPDDIFGQQAQSQKEATLFVPVTKQEHDVDFEPKVVDLMQDVSPVVSVPEQPVVVPEVPTQAAVPVEITPVPMMTEMNSAVVMKTPQRVDGVAGQATQEQEPRLAEIPVSGDVVDLRMLEQVEKKK